jgi:large subunit ribosomal protein L32e
MKKDPLLKLRNIMNSKRPKFQRQESWRYVKVNENWRRPRGMDSKMRKRVKGWPQSPNIGYRGPKKTRGVHPSGYGEVLVHSPDSLDQIDPETHVIRISHTVGRKKRVEIIAMANERGIRVLNRREERGAEELIDDIQ